MKFPILNLLVTYFLFQPAFTCIASESKQPLAWIEFTRYEKQVAQFNGFYMYYVDGRELIFEIDVPPDPKHKLAFRWICKQGPKRSMKVTVNGRSKTFTHPSEGNGKQSNFWDKIPVGEFGIDKVQKGNYKILIGFPDDGIEDALFAGIRLIDQDEQTKPINLKSSNHKVKFIFPGSMTEAEKAKTKVNRKEAIKRIQKAFVSKTRLTKKEISEDEFLQAAVKFADMVVEHGRDIYGTKHSPLFVNNLHVDALMSPRQLGSLRPDQGGPAHPIVPANFDRVQNLLRLLASLSQFTGDPKYAMAAMDSVIYMFDEFTYPNSGIPAMGNHMTVDLYSDRAYSDGRLGEIFELEDVWPFYEFFYQVSPEKTEKFVKSCWETYVRDWHTMHYNRHASFNVRPDLSKTWNRPLQAVKDMPVKMNVLGFIDVGLDLAYAGYTLGCVQDQLKPRQWSERFLQVIAYHRDPKTKIWPMLLYTPPIRRGLEAYVKAYPDSNPSEPRVIISSWIHNMPIFFLGTLGTLEQAQRFGHKEELKDIQEKVDAWILGYMKVAYDAENHRMRSILLDGRDVTNHVFKEGASLYGWGAEPNKSFSYQHVHPSFHAAVARAYRLTHSKETRKELWGVLRKLFIGSGLGDIGETAYGEPDYNFKTKSADQPYVFALADMYRVTRDPYILKFMEHMGRNIIRYRQDAKTGLFSIEPSRQYTVRHVKESKYPHEDLTVKEYLQLDHGGIQLKYDRPKSVSTDAFEPHALLAIYGCRTAEFDKIPIWLSGGLWGRGGVSLGHAIDVRQEIWFDREKLEKYYDGQKIRLKERGFTVTEDWFPEGE